MTLVGKIFTVLIFIMALVFGGMTVAVYQTQKVWRDVAVNSDPDKGVLGYKQQLELEKERYRALQEENERSKDALARERGARRQTIAALETRVALAREALLAKEKDFNVKIVSEREALAAVETTHNHLEKLKAEIELLRKEIVVVREDRDAKFGQVVKLTDDVHQAMGMQKRLAERQTQLTDQLAKAKRKLDEHGLKMDDPVRSVIPVIEGDVLLVSRDRIEISIGSDDGLREGHQLDVYRGSAFLGRVKVSRTAPDKAVADIIREMLKGEIKRGDRVKTKVS